MTSRIIPVLLVLIAVGLFFGYVHPTYGENVAALRAEIRGYDAALRAANAFAEKEAYIARERASIPESDLARLSAFLPDGVDNVQLILDLNALATRSGLTLSDFDVVENRASDSGSAMFALESDSPVDSIDLSLTAVGTYASFKAFLAGTERSLRLLDLVELTIDDSETGVYAYGMTFRIYWLKAIDL